MKKGNVLPELNWKTKLNGRGTRSMSNVSVTILKSVKDDEIQKRVSFTIRDNLWKQFEGEYLMFAVLKNRIYFKGTDNKQEGYKITVKSVNATVVACLSTKEEIENYEAFIGDYTLRFDKYYGLYYIDIEREAVDGESLSSTD